MEASLSAEYAARIAAQEQYRKSKLRNEVLLKKVDLLIRMVNELRAEQGLDPITDADIAAE